MNPEEVGNRLRSARLALGWTSQKDFAEACDIGVTAYNNWENGRQLPKPSQLVKVCERFGLTMDFVYRGKLDALPMNLSKDISSSFKDKAQSRSSEMPEAAEAPTKFSNR